MSAAATLSGPSLTSAHRQFEAALPAIDRTLPLTCSAAGPATAATRRSPTPAPPLARLARPAAPRPGPALVGRDRHRRQRRPLRPQRPPARLPARRGRGADVLDPRVRRRHGLRVVSLDETRGAGRTGLVARVAGRGQPGRPGRRGVLPARLRGLAGGPAGQEAPDRRAAGRGSRRGRRGAAVGLSPGADQPGPGRAGGELGGVPGRVGRGASHLRDRLIGDHCALTSWADRDPRAWETHAERRGRPRSTDGQGNPRAGPERRGES